MVQITTAGSKEKIQVERQVLVDARPINVKLSYENGNKRSHLLYMADNGFTSMFSQLQADSSFEFVWPKEAKEILLVYGSDEDSEDLEYDHPIVVKKNEISPAFKESEGQIFVEVYVDNSQKSVRKNGKKKPAKSLSHFKPLVSLKSLA